jgi:acyl carrier protein
VAYVVPAGADEPTGTELRAYLRDRLPAYMVPSLFVTLGQIPRTPNGKVDRRALPDPVARAAVVHAPPTTPMERAIAAIWCEVLGVDHVGVNDNFFDLGGHSLLSMQVIARVERAVGVRLGAREFVLQTLGQIAAHCAAQVAARGPDERVGEKGAVTPRSLARRLLGLVTGRGVGS